MLDKIESENIDTALIEEEAEIIQVKREEEQLSINHDGPSFISPNGSFNRAKVVNNSETNSNNNLSGI